MMMMPETEIQLGGGGWLLHLYTSTLKFYTNFTNIALLNFFCKKSRILFPSSGITATLNNRFREPLVDIWDADIMPFTSLE